MNIAVCFKIVPSDTGVKSRADRSMDISKTELEISSFDMNAIEAAMNVSSSIADSKVIAVTVNDSVVDNAKMRKAALSRGPAELVTVNEPLLAQSDAYAIAKTLAATIRKIGDCQLVVCGEGSADMYNQQVGNMLGFMLGYNTVNGVCGIKADDNCLIVERAVETGVEVMEVQFPAVVSVTSDINIPRIPSMKDILGAGKKPFTSWTESDLNETVESRSETISVLAPSETDRKKTIFDGSDASKVEEFLAVVTKIL